MTLLPYSLEWYESIARPSQLEPPGDWRTWLILAGRGWGKTRTGAEWVRWRIANGARRVALVAPTAADARDVMVEGESGLLAVCRDDAVKPIYQPGLRRILFPKGSALSPEGAVCTTYSAEEPDRLRGPQHDCAWCDELAAWKHPSAWDMLMFGLRLGEKPRVLVTTTPRPTEIIRELVDAESTTVTTGSTYENEANLSPTFMERILDKYEGTRLGRQELHAEILLDTPGALWTREMLEQAVKLWPRKPPEMSKVVVAVDPAVTSGENSDDTGIVVAGRDKDRGYVVADYTCHLSPDGWARRAVEAYHEHRADRIVAEANQGGDMVRLTIRSVDPSVPVKLVHATRGKRLRAEPIAALYEQGKIAHAEVFAELEDELLSWTPEVPKSPDRMDALVWALTDLDLTRPVGVRKVAGPRF